MNYLTSEPIDFQAVTDSVRDTRAGAVVLFLGTVRELTGKTVTEQLTYEAFEEMANAQMDELRTKAVTDWSLTRAKMVHRIGELQPGDVAVAVAVSSPHRDAAFEAGRWLLNEIKKSVPLWKKEHFGDGTTEWQHPVDGVPTMQNREASS